MGKHCAQYGDSSGWVELQIYFLLGGDDYHRVSMRRAGAVVSFIIISFEIPHT